MKSREPRPPLNSNIYVRSSYWTLRDRDPLFTAEFLKMLAEVGIQSVKLPLRSPNLNCSAQ
jgi:hypothetical protein